MTGAATTALPRATGAALVPVAVLVAAAWIVLAAEAIGTARGLPSFVCAAPGLEWSATGAARTFGMWIAMCVAMMLPTALPLVFAFARIHARLAPGTAVAVAALVAGFLAAWSAFAALAAAAHGALAASGRLTPAVALVDRELSAALLVAAGLYQFLPWKHACLRGCRSPIETLAEGWPADAAGAAALGLRSGAFCVGCCWAMMAATFAVGAMDLGWALAFSLLMLAEKTLPRGPALARWAGAALVAAGSFTLLV